MERNDPTAIDPEAPYKLPLDVSAPFGADHLVAVASAHEQSDLLKTLRKPGWTEGGCAGSQGPGAERVNSQVRLGIQGLFTRER